MIIYSANGIGNLFYIFQATKRVQLYSERYAKFNISGTHAYENKNKFYAYVFYTASGLQLNDFKKQNFKPKLARRSCDASVIAKLRPKSRYRNV